MNRISKTFLSLFSSTVNNEEFPDPSLNANEWHSLFLMAREQGVLPLTFEAAFRLPSFHTLEKRVFSTFQEAAVTSVIRQITQANEFLTLILHSQAQCLDPIVLKGIICRNLYPLPYLRPSVDEDILVSVDEVDSFHQFLLAEGLSADEASVDPQTTTELSYHKDNSPTYIEMQKTLFDPKSELFGDFNKLFDGIMERTIRVQIEDVSVRTLAPTDHLLYLILHAFKHFVHSGIGIRAVCDIGMFAKHYSAEIDWQHIRNCLEQVHAFTFASALFCIIMLYLLPDADYFNCISDWQFEELDVEPLLEDILASGVHGNSSLERLHSSNITLDAITKDKKNIAGTGFLSSAFHSIFLPLENMTGRYPYLKKAPYLLPIAWGQRIGSYLKESRANNKDSASESIRLGRSRVELLKKYGIIR